MHVVKLNMHMVGCMLIHFFFFLLMELILKTYVDQKTRKGLSGSNEGKSISGICIRRPLIWKHLEDCLSMSTVPWNSRIPELYSMSWVERG